ncbi:vWA domain-containing protein [Mucisphaera calidilacus]|uniref:VWFA domain-containing protein n=1 Tax=Mucisphaera calidilacus TaxID=2527982 RepID=A0A518BZJ5_9BACT|nr:vWA domain-containing protein [Mucisphaera calidilacus]QDU72388.1 hypothetical protein Pan265_22530 [Mucisphaera calidilacus]
MTMTLLAPLVAGLAAAVALPTLLLLYFLKLRRQRRDVASTLLWRKAVEDLQVNAPFQRLRGSWLLVLQLLLLLMLLGALARPVINAESIETGRAVILIDHSASMNAEDEGGRTRLDRARELGSDLIDRLEVENEGGRAMVVHYASRARVQQTMTGQKSLLREAVGRVAPTDQPTDLAPALRLVEPLAEQALASGTPMTVYVVTDGGSDQAQAVDRVDLHDAQVVFVSVDPEDAGVPGNLAVTAFSARRDPERPERVALFAEVSNFGDRPASATVRFLVGDQSRRTQVVSLGPAGERGPSVEAMSLSLALPDLALLTVELVPADAGQDRLRADNAARLVLTAARTTKVLLVSESGNALMEHAIRASGVERLVVEPPAYLSTDAALEADVWVFDRVDPPGVPARPSLCFDVVPSVEGLELVRWSEGDPASTRPLDWQRGHPMLRHVAFEDLVIREAGRLVLPQGARVLATSPAGPLMAEVRIGARRHVVAAFDPLRTNWPVMVGFPVFFDNALRYLVLGGEKQGTLAAATGSSWAVPGPGVEASGVLVYDGPERIETPVEGDAAILPPLERVGLYRTASPVEPAYQALAVNLLNPAESDLRPYRDEASVVATSASGRAVAVPREVWSWLAVGALVLLMLEWGLYAWRTRV